MKKFKVLLVLSGLMGLLSLGAASSVHAQSFRTGDVTNVGSSEVIDSSLYAAGRTVDISAEVQGDLYCAGQNVTVSGKVHGDILCAGQTVQILGEVDGDIRVAGQTVTLQGKVTGSATIAAQSFVQDSKAQIGKDLTLGSSDATLNGFIGRDIVLGGASIHLSGTVGRNITGSVDSFRLENSAIVGGKVDYTSANQLQKSEQAKVAGNITRHEPKDSGHSKRGAVFGFAIGWFLYCLMAMSLITLVLILLLPRLLRVLTDRALANPWKPLLVGLTTSIIVPIMLVVLLITVIGIPLAIMLGLVWLLICFTSAPVSGYYVGRQVLPRDNNEVLTALVGSALLLVLYFIPFIGFFIFLLAFWLGSGVIVMEFSGRVHPRSNTHAHKAKSTLKN